MLRLSFWQAEFFSLMLLNLELYKRQKSLTRGDKWGIIKKIKYAEMVEWSIAAVL